MNKRLKLGLVFMLLCLSGWQTSAVAAVGVSDQERMGPPSSINRTDDRPQWQDVKMHDALAVTSSSTLTPPTTVRVLHDSPSGIVPASHAAQARHYNVQRLLAYSHRRIVCGYIYKIRSLRL